MWTRLLIPSHRARYRHFFFSVGAEEAKSINSRKFVQSSKIHSFYFLLLFLEKKKRIRLTQSTFLPSHVHFSSEHPSRVSMQQKLDIVRFETWILRVAPKRDFAVSRRNDQTQCAALQHLRGVTMASGRRPLRNHDHRLRSSAGSFFVPV
jgi:hypothetical protein